MVFSDRIPMPRNISCSRGPTPHRWAGMPRRYHEMFAYFRCHLGNTHQLIACSHQRLHCVIAYGPKMNESLPYPGCGAADPCESRVYEADFAQEPGQLLELSMNISDHIDGCACAHSNTSPGVPEAEFATQAGESFCLPELTNSS